MGATAHQTECVGFSALFGMQSDRRKTELESHEPHPD